MPLSVVILAEATALSVATWAAAGHAENVLAAAVAVSSFAFVAFGVDASGRAAVRWLAAGLAIGILGLLSRHVAPAFGIAGVALAGAWLAPFAFRHLDR